MQQHAATHQIDFIAYDHLYCLRVCAVLPEVIHPLVGKAVQRLTARHIKHCSDIQCTASTNSGD
jgi:hypothetical protein